MQVIGAMFMFVNMIWTYFGEFTKKSGLIAKEIIGFDVTANFVQAGLENKQPNVSFVLGKKDCHLK